MTVEGGPVDERTSRPTEDEVAAAGESESSEVTSKLTPQQTIEAPISALVTYINRFFPSFGEPAAYLSQETINAVVERIAKELSSGALSTSDIAFHLLRSTTSDAAQEANNRVFLAYTSAAKNHPEYVRGLMEIENLIGQDAQVVSPKVYVEGLADLLWRPSVPDTLKTSLLHAAN